MPIPESDIQSAQTQLDAHLREIIAWHFSPESGCPYWLDWATKNFDPHKEVSCFADLIAKFPHFQDESLRDLQPEVWVSAQFKGKPFNIFETGGTTGMPKQRIGWNDYKVDYSEFSDKISDEHFPRNHYWLMMGPTGPRRLRLAIEHLANVRGSSCYFIDLDPRFVKKVISNKQFDVARAYMDHVVDQAVTILKHRNNVFLKDALDVRKRFQIPGGETPADGAPAQEQPSPARPAAYRPPQSQFRMPL